ncbi:restriction endonuclease subunit S [Kitasatospora sp. NPDC057500]|uniref:restriction endonuclease subunit S n=1 Tax=Kitasatospora sp. NPDC057500 TaxID=3346151 RepID=UPI0036BCA2E2
MRIDRSVLASVAWPSEWRTVPLWALFDRVKDVGHPQEELLSVYRELGVVKRAGRDDNFNKAAPDRNIYQLIDPGWLVVNRMKAWQGSVGISPYRGIVSGHYICFRPRHREESRFLNWLLRSGIYATEFASLSRGVRPGQVEIDNDLLRVLPVKLPAVDEQRRIADFLDAETARVDRIVEARDAQRSTLRERELALIYETLSGGASPENGRPTGMPWLPVVPKDWKVGPVYGYFTTELGKMLNAERAAGDRQRPYLRNANVHWYGIDTSDMATMSFDVSEVRRYSVEPGDLLVCEGGAGVAEAAVWNGEISECYYQKSLHRVRQSGSVPVEWLMYWLRLAKHVGVFAADGNIATIPHLTGEQLREYRIPIPPDGDRRVAKLNREVHELMSAINRLDHAEALLAERRQALITAAVTGQLDVTTARPKHDRDF